MTQSRIIGFSLVFITFSLLVGIPQASSAALHSEQRMLLQTYLQAYEIRAEIKRLEQTENKLNQKQKDVEKTLLQQEAKFEKNRERAGKLLRTYYLGERDMFWLSLFSANSMVDALYAYEMMMAVFDNEMRDIERYLDAYLKTKELEQSLLQTEKELTLNRRALESQEKRVATMQRKLESALASHPNAKQLIEQWQTFATRWQNTGLPLFHQYFKAMAKTMAGLPTYLMGKRQFTGTTLYIKDTQINEYLRVTNPIFRNTNVSFRNGQVIVTGRDRGIRVEIAGTYVVEQEPDNVIRFRMQRLAFEGIALPKTTMAFLTRMYDLNLYTRDMTNFAEIRSIEMQDGEMKIRVRILF